jgi:hypothetical protein
MYLPAYPAVLTELIHGMSDHDKVKMHKMADKWNREGAPPDVMAK